MTDHVDVLIVGAGLSGIGAAAQLTREHPDRSFVILEKRAVSGGTWDLFRYPGVRSDSDMFTLGYRFKPWTDERSLADGPSILAYVRETATEHGIDEHIRYDHDVTSAAWDSATATWTVRVGTPTGPQELTTSLLWMCGGYYDYDQGFTPDFAGLHDFRGQLVHPQHWPADLDHADKLVVVIGSGATAVTLVPALAASGAEHVTMLQRTPTYVLSVPSVDRLAVGLRKVLGPAASHVVNRWRNITVSTALYQFTRRRPAAARKLIRRLNTSWLPVGYDVDTHFNPPYDPWDQRMCLVPDSDLFKEIGRGRASVVTAAIEAFTPTGIRLASGEELEADVVVTATGLNLLAFGGIELTVDGSPVELADTMAYKALMLSGVPNFVFTIGYTNASWTLKADLVAEYVCRLLSHLDKTGQQYAVARPDPSVRPTPFMDFTPGYVLRGIDQLPKQGDVEPWKLKQNYVYDMLKIRRASINDGVLDFG